MAPPEELPDHEHVRRACAGDQRAFDALVARHRKGVVSIPRGVLGDWDEADDAAQEAFVEALKGLGDLQRAESFGAWLMTIARRCASRRLRADATRPEYVPAPETVAFGATGLDRSSGDDRVGQRVADALAVLSARDRRVVVLHYLDGLSVREVSQRMDLPAGTVKRVLHESRNSMRREMGIMTRPGPTEDGPRRLIWWLNGDGGPGHMMHGLLPGAICLAANQKARTARQLADEVSAHVAYVREALEPLLGEALMAQTANGRYRTNFVALDAGDWLGLSDLTRAVVAEASQMLHDHIDRLECAWNQTAQPDRGVAWSDSIWQVAGVLIANAGVARQFPARPDPPRRVSGRRYALRAHEATSENRGMWTTGFNTPCGSSESTMGYGRFWTYGLPHLPVWFDIAELAALTAMARGAATADAVLAQARIESEDAREALGRLIVNGIVRRDGERLSLTFPVFDDADERVLLPLVDEIAHELVVSLLWPGTEDVVPMLEDAGYGHLREQLDEWRLCVAGNMMGEALRELMARGVLPAAGESAPANFGLLGWLGGLRLLSWTQ